MADHVLRGAGYRTVLLGGGMPKPALRAALIRHRPAVVALSSTMFRAGALATTAEMVHRTLPGAHLIAGGRSAAELPREERTHRVERVDDLLALVESLPARDRVRACDGAAAARCQARRLVEQRDDFAAAPHT